MDWTKFNAIVQLAAEGKSIREIEERLKVDYSTVKRAVPHIQPRKTGHPWDEAKKVQVGEMVMAGASLNEIRRTLGVDHRTIKKYFPKAGMVQGSPQHKEATRMGRKMAEIEKKGDLL